MIYGICVEWLFYWSDIFFVSNENSRPSQTVGNNRDVEQTKNEHLHTYHESIFTNTVRQHKKQRAKR